MSVGFAEFSLYLFIYIFQAVRRAVKADSHYACNATLSTQRRPVMPTDATQHLAFLGIHIVPRLRVSRYIHLCDSV